jgi:hypothetical protein
MRSEEASPPLPLRERGRLWLPAPGSLDGRPHVAAASGLVRRGPLLWVVADDEPALVAFAVADGRAARVVALSAEPLPADPAARKAVKPDLESLADLPPAPGRPDGALLALGSGATPRRDRGWLWPMREQAVEIDLGLLYATLRAELDDLNVEGAALADGRLWLAQRGNGAAGRDALVELAAEPVLAAIGRGEPVPGEALVAVRPVELGEAGDVPLTLSDLEPLPDGRLVCCAIAEAVASTYDDGPCVGAAVGILDPRRGVVERLAHLATPVKVEGVAASPAPGGGLDLLLVADADDPAVAAPLLEARL